MHGIVLLLNGKPARDGDTPGDRCPFTLDGATHANFDVGREGSLLLVRPVRQPRTIVICDLAELVRQQVSGSGK